ncbi:hypothetical protein EX30DRAFT_379457 [Ascodesmis nigricans]|uniref:Retrotransposon gag domain-containing protein n=1 Tax=Ascodesmis nigricans TaxID=341454 RepID=A0A4S2MV49_9PEZI|nr:hypothetical protein EX30DRAFT_379457 [Ascodesmis nigricans]
MAARTLSYNGASTPGVIFRRTRDGMYTCHRHERQHRLRKRGRKVSHYHEHIHIHVHIPATEHNTEEATEADHSTDTTEAEAKANGRRTETHKGLNGTEANNGTDTSGKMTDRYQTEHEGWATPRLQMLIEVIKAVAEANRPIMLQPLTAGAPSFNGRNVTKILQNFERMVKTYGSKQPLDSFIEELPDYCTNDIAEEVRLLKGYSEGNWKVFRQSMETRYALRDSEQAKYSITYLRTAADEYKQGILTMRDYYTRYSIAAGKMKRKGLITDQELVTLFNSGLSKEQQIEAVKKTQVDRNDPSSLNWDSMVDVVEKWVSYEDALAAMLGSAEAAESQSMAAAPKQVSWDPQPRRALAPSGGYGPAPNPASAAPRWDYEAMVDDVIEKFGNLSLANKRAVKSRVMEITQGEGDRMTVVNVINTVLPEFKSTALEIPSSPYQRREMRPDRPLVCYYCSMEGHTVQFCGDLVIDRSQGLVHKGEDGMRRTGTVTNPGRTIPLYRQREGATEKDWVRANQPSIHGTSSGKVYASYRRWYGEVAKELEEAEVIKWHDGVM